MRTFVPSCARPSRFLPVATIRIFSLLQKKKKKLFAEEICAEFIFAGDGFKRDFAE